MTGVLINTITVIVGSCVGLLLKKGIPQRLTNAVMVGIGLCTLYIGVDGMLQGENTLVLIVSMVLGALVGTWLDLDGKIQSLGDWIENRFRSSQPIDGADWDAGTCCVESALVDGAWVQVGYMEFPDLGGAYPQAFADYRAAGAVWEGWSWCNPWAFFRAG